MTKAPTYTPGYTDEERDQYWIEIIVEARKHPMGITDYLTQHGIEKNNYYQWFKKLRKAHPEWKDLSKDPKHRAMREKTKGRDRLPKTEVQEKPKRRRHSPEEKLRILNEVDAAGPGKGNSILRREGIYSSQIHQWRLERAGGLLVERKRGPKPNLDAQEIKELKAQLAKTEKKLAKANALLELQKKVAEILKSEEEADD